MLPDVVITSYLGPPERRAKRLEFHTRQRQLLAEVWPTLKVQSMCSGYDEKEKETLKCLGFEARHLPTRAPKWVKQNLFLAELYKAPALKAILFLDDDVVPRIPKDTDAENGLVDCRRLVEFLIKNPDQMTAPCAYFACQGLRFDAFYRSQPPVGPAPPQVVGWAMMMRSDLGVLYDKQLVTDAETGLVLDDLPFRCRCAQTDRPVVKFGRAFFKTYQSTDDAREQSAWFRDAEHRHKTQQVFLAKMRRECPKAFGRKKSATQAGGFFDTGETQ